MIKKETFNKHDQKNRRFNLDRLSVAYSILVALFLLSTACSEEEIQHELSITLSEENLTVSPGASTNTIEVEANGDWAVTNVPNWSTVEPTSGTVGTTRVRISVNPRSESEEDAYRDRSATLRFGNKEFTLLQRRIGALTLSPAEFNIGIEGDTITVELIHNVDVKVEIQTDEEGWIQQIERGKTRAMTTTLFHFEIKPAESYLPRSGKIIISNVDNSFQSETIEVHQDALSTPPAPAPTNLKRMLWASINGRSDANHRDLWQFNNKILVSWRMFPTDDESTAFDLYRTGGNGQEVKLNSKPISNTTNFQDADADRTVDNTYRLCYAGSNETLDTYTITAQQALNGLPYVSIPLRSTADIDPRVEYFANDASIGDVDGDGEYEIILKRLASLRSDDDDDNEEETVDEGLLDVRHQMLLEAYKLDGTFLWRMALGPNISTGNGGSFAVYDFDNDGRAEIALRTSEGTIFGDGEEIGDVNGDGQTDYREKGRKYIGRGPEFLSVIDGSTGKELARTDYIARGKSEDWGDNYFKRASSFRISLGRFSENITSIVMCRGVYAKSVLEAWDFTGGKLTRRWRFDTEDGIHRSYRGQGNHNLSVGDVDGDGFHEIVYGACTIDHDGTGLNNSGFGHGDALHLGKFDPSRPGLQIWSCFEGGPVGAAFRDAKTGDVIWKYDNPGDIGRALVADIDPNSPGCEMWWYQSNAYSPDGRDTGYRPGSCNMAIWFGGSLNRQLLDRSTIDQPYVGRIFTLYRYEVTTINGTKSNPCFYGDIFGDWREEVIQVTSDNSELRVFSTWYPTEYKFPYLMSDQVYEMSAINQNVGYNQPTQLGYYLGSDLIKEDSSTGGGSDTEKWDGFHW